MSNPSEATLAGDYATVTITVGASAASLIALATAGLAAIGYTKTSEILQVTILGTLASGVSRADILFGGETAQNGFLITNAERVFPVRGSRVYVRRFGAVDVPAVLEIFLRKQ